MDRSSFYIPIYRAQIYRYGSFTSAFGKCLVCPQARIPNGILMVLVSDDSRGLGYIGCVDTPSADSRSIRADPAANEIQLRNRLCRHWSRLMADGG